MGFTWLTLPSMKMKKIMQYMISKIDHFNMEDDKVVKDIFLGICLDFPQAK